MQARYEFIKGDGMKYGTALLLILLTGMLFAEGFKADSVPNPRKTYGGWVADENNYLSSEDKLLINNEISIIERETSAEIAVVIVPTTDGDIFKAAQEIFDKWKIGKKDKNNGILLLASIEERKFRTHTGYGIEPIMPDGLCRILQDNIVVPEFREKRYGKGILDYVKTIRKLLKNQDISSEIRPEHQAKTESWINSGDMWILLFPILGFAAVIAGAVLLFYRIKSLIVSAGKHYNSYTQIKILGSEKHGFVNDTGIIIIFLLIWGEGFGSPVFFILKGIPVLTCIIIASIPALLILINVLISIAAFVAKRDIIHNWRTHPRNCPHCGALAGRLKESESLKYLEPFEKVEEKLKTVEYDVWICNKCGEKIIERYEDKKYSFYVECPECHAVTGKHTQTKIITAPTESSAGERELFFTCMACSNAFSKTETISRITYSSSSGSSSFSGEGGSSDFGGGSSGGGGSTSSW